MVGQRRLRAVNFCTARREFGSRSGNFVDRLTLRTQRVRHAAFGLGLDVRPTLVLIGLGQFGELGLGGFEACGELLAEASCLGDFLRMPLAQLAHLGLRRLRLSCALFGSCTRRCARGSGFLLERAHVALKLEAARLRGG